ncbi:MAG: 6-phospho-beta-glucosidase [Chloroflexota bacterium]
MGRRIAIIGAGSTYTPELIEGLTGPGALAIDELVLEDRDAARLDVVGGLAQRMAAHRGWRGRMTLTTDLDAALTDADFVLVQLRVGGQAARLLDETIPLRFGTIGQETTGAGGFAKALRTVPVVLDIAERAARLAARGSWLIDFTNPVGIVTQALLDAGHRAIGLCNIGVIMERRMATVLGVDARAVQLAHVGLNHLSWEQRVLVDGTDRLPGLLEAHAGEWAAEVGRDGPSLCSLGVLPSSYLRYFDAFGAVLAEQRRDGTRARDVIEIERGLLAQYADPGLVSKPALLERRGGAFYSEAAARLVESLATATGTVQVVNVRNGGAVPGMADDDVVEVSARVDAGGAEPLPTTPLPAALLALMRQVKAYERLAIRAARSGAREDARRALEANPLVGPRIGDVGPLLDALLEAHAEHLPRFAARSRGR